MDKIQIRVEKAHPSDFGRGIARLDPDTLLRLKLSPGDIVEIIGKKRTVAKIWRAYRKDWEKGFIKIDGFIRQNAGVGTNERVEVKKAKTFIAKKVLLAPLEGMMIEFGDKTSETIKRNILKRPLVKGDVVPIISSIAGGQTIPLIAIETDPKDEIIIIDEETEIELRRKPVKGYENLTKISYEDIGGLRDEVQKVREVIELPLKRPEIFNKLNIEPPKGVLLYGPSGTGKTLIAKAVANEAGVNFIYVAGPEIMGKYYGESEERIRKIFEDAANDGPSIIFIDEIDSITQKRENVTGELEIRIVAQFLTMMDGLKDRGQVVVIGATNRIDSIDPALRRPGRFDREIEIGVPSKEDRLEILQIHTRGMPLEEEIDLSFFANKTQGFVGADLLALAQESAICALRRYLPEIDIDEKVPQELIDKISITPLDFEDALREIEPSAMREVFVELPSIGWKAIGGLNEVIQEVIESVELPIKTPEKFEELGIKPPKGILLFGPPGTGKTLIAKAVATESNANFISINGPQMLSKWVGESEKAIREIFKKARQVAPCVIFFDEIDSIAQSRNSSSSDGKVSERVVNQLLTEMDGLKPLKEIVVIAATNRPDMIDPALLRPGRFDRIVLVGQPSKDERAEIFKIHTKDIPLADSVDLVKLASKTQGYVGADIESICREAVMLALRDDFDVKEIEMNYFNASLKKIRPTISSNIMEYYEKIQDEFKGGIRTSEPSSYIGYR